MSRKVHGDDDLVYEPPPGAPGAGNRLLDKLLGTGFDDALAPKLAARPEPVARPEPAPKHEPAARPPKEEDRPVRRRAEPVAREEEDVEPEDTGDDWWRQMFAEGTAFILFGAAPAAIDMACTVFGITATVLPATRWGMALAAVLHVFISIGQRHFLVQRGPVRLIGLGLLVVNTVLNVYGIMPALDVWLSPDFLGAALPRDPGQWLPDLLGAIWGAPSLGAIWAARWSFVVEMPVDTLARGVGGLLASFLGGGEALWPLWPSWILSAFLLTIFCGVIAWRAEPNLAWWYLRARHVWRRR